MLYIGVDLGTSAVKLLLMDGEGKILNIVSKESLFMFTAIQRRIRKNIAGSFRQW